MQSRSVSYSALAAMLCLVGGAQLVARAQDCDDGFTAADGRCRPCGDFQELVCVGADGSRFCTGDRVIPGPERCERCGEFGREPCDDEDEPCDAPNLFPAPDDNGICRPCGARLRTCCPPASGEPPCRFDFQECVNGFCLRCDVADPDPGCPGFTGLPPPVTEPVPMLDVSECAEGATPNSRGGCSPCGGFAQLVCVGEDGSRFCTDDRVTVGPTRCDRCGTFGNPPCDDEDEPCDAPDLFPAPDDNGICRPCGARLRTCCPPASGEPPCRFDFQECVNGFCLRCDVADPDPGCPGVPVEEEEEAEGPSEIPMPEAMMMGMMMGTADGTAEEPEDAYGPGEGPSEGPAAAPV